MTAVVLLQSFTLRMDCRDAVAPTHPFRWVPATTYPPNGDQAYIVVQINWSFEPPVSFAPSNQDRGRQSLQTPAIKGKSHPRTCRTSSLLSGPATPNLPVVSILKRHLALQNQFLTEPYGKHFQYCNMF